MRPVQKTSSTSFLGTIFDRNISGLPARILSNMSLTKPEYSLLPRLDHPFGIPHEIVQRTTSIRIEKCDSVSDNNSEEDFRVRDNIRSNSPPKHHEDRLPEENIKLPSIS